MSEFKINSISYYFKKIFDAKNELLICSPYLSPNYLIELIDCSKKNVKVKLITSLGNNGIYRSTLWILNNITCNENFEFKIIDRLHAKIYIADQNFAIHGSANLTESGLKSNLEQIHVIDKNGDVLELKKIFNEIWDKGIERNIEIVSNNKHHLKNSKKEQVISDAKNYIIENLSNFKTKNDLIFSTKEYIRAYHHLGEERLDNYLKIVLSDLIVKEKIDLNKIFDFQLED